MKELETFLQVTFDKFCIKHQEMIIFLIIKTLKFVATLNVILITEI